MVYQPPIGARDLLPLDVAQKHWIEDRLEQVFQRWGYHPIITSTVERLDTLVAGGAINPNAVVELPQTPVGQRLGLRPELTASIARTAVSRLTQVTYPQRLYYHANVFRQTPQGQQEFYQSGVELLGAPAPLADAEILLLVCDCLTGLNLAHWTLVLGDAQLTRALLEPFPAALRSQVRQALAHLDRVALQHLDLTPPLYHRALALLDLRGEPEDILQSLSQSPLDAAATDAITRMKNLVALLRQGALAAQGNPAGGPGLVLDLSLIQTFDYYTGLVFEVVSTLPGECQVIAQGGRYDNLLGVFHSQGHSFPGIGFVLKAEVMHQCLLRAGLLPQTVPASDWLVVPLTPQAVAAAFTYAQTLRSSATMVRAEVHLADFTSRETIRSLVRERRIRHLAWIATQAPPEIEIVSRA